MPIPEKSGLLPMKLNAVVLDCRDVAALSDFYARLLGWKKAPGSSEEWTDLVDPRGGARIGFQKNEDYVPPVWPEEKGKQQQMEHLDFIVQDKTQREEAVRHAIACGAAKAEKQYSADWTVMRDPAGHPFCIVE